ncbi:MAG: 3'-5' exonuclease [Chloroflexi bacterium]|nr:3'-5' exonuclease [Chloroflexota bacterium]
MNSFVALDVETANSDYASICSIGAARYDDGLVVDEWYRLVDPCDEFGSIQMGIHGIRPEDVAGKPRFIELLPEMQEFVDDQLVVHHGHFDRSAITKASKRWQQPPPPWEYRDSAQVARQAWPQFAKRGYNLKNLCAEIGHELEHHHNALDDARAAGAVFIAAMQRLGGDSLGVQRGLWPDYDQLLAGEVIVFSQNALLPAADTQFERTLRRQGARVQRQLSNSATIYVLSDEEWRSEVTTGQRQRAGQRVGRGQRLQIMSKTDFLAMIEHG